MENTPQNLQNFQLSDLAQFTKEGAYASNASQDVHWFFVGRDNVHEVLKYLISGCSVSLYMNMYGFDDPELNTIIMDKVKDQSILTVITLDKSQAGGTAEKKLLDEDRTADLSDFNTHFTIGESATHQISHTKGGVIDGKIAWEGSTNLSQSGEGIFVVAGNGQAGGVGYKAQNNTLTVCVDPNTCAMFTAELISEHLAAQKQQKN